MYQYWMFVIIIGRIQTPVPYKPFYKNDKVYIKSGIETKFSKADNLKIRHHSEQKHEEKANSTYFNSKCP